MAKKVVKKKVSNKKSVKKVVSNKPTLMGAAHAWKGFIFFLVLILVRNHLLKALLNSVNLNP